jgi:hypothetical protein
LLLNLSPNGPLRRRDIHGAADHRTISGLLCLHSQRAELTDLIRQGEIRVGGIQRVTPHLRNPNPAKAVIRILCTGLIRNLRRIATGGGLVGSPGAPAGVLRGRIALCPTIVPPASRIRSTTVASMSGMYPSSVADPFIMGTPASMILSLSATVLPASLPAGAPCTVVFTYHAL